MGFDNNAYIGDDYSIPGDYTKKQLKHENNLAPEELTIKKSNIKEDKLQVMEFFLFHTFSSLAKI